MSFNPVADFSPLSMVGITPNLLLILPDVIEKFEQYGAEDGGGTPEKFASFIQTESVKWAKVVKEAGVKADS